MSFQEYQVELQANWNEGDGDGGEEQDEVVVEQNTTVIERERPDAVVSGSSQMSLAELANQIIVTAGKDREDRLILVCNGCYFPDPKDVNYDDLLKVLLRKLDEFVARDYVLLFFGGGMQHKPSLGWMISAYKSLTRSYKKNIKHLYVVHPTWWFSFVIWLMATIVSDKFAKKIVMIKKLSLLPVHVPMQSLVIPELVKRHDERRGNPPVANASALTTPIAGNRQRASTGVRHTQRRRGEIIFGGELVSQDPELESAPEAVDSLISYLQQNGVNEVEIFRTSPATSDIAELKDRLNRGLEVRWDDYAVGTLAGLLKAWVRELPEPLIPVGTYHRLMDVLELEGQAACVHYIQQNFLEPMGARERKILGDIMRMLRAVADNAAINEMTPMALAMVWTPNLIRPRTPQEEMQLNKSSRRLVQYIIEYCDSIFP